MAVHVHFDGESLDFHYKNHSTNLLEAQQKEALATKKTKLIIKIYFMKTVKQHFEVVFLKMLFYRPRLQKF